MMKNIANVCICVWNICIMYQCQYSLSKKDMLSSASQPSSHYPLLLVETVLHKLCCRTSPIFMNKNSPQNKFITQSFRKNELRTKIRLFGLQSKYTILYYTMLCYINKLNRNRVSKKPTCFTVSGACFLRSSRTASTLASSFWSPCRSFFPISRKH